MAKPLSSEFLKKRGSCCKSSCLHCPYGFTLRTLGVKIIPSSQCDKNIIEELKDEILPSEVTSSLLGNAFGNKPKRRDEDLHLLSLKDISCGLAYVSDRKLLEYYLLPDFADQGITFDYLNSLLRE